SETSRTVSGAGAADAARSWPYGRPAPGLALAGSSAQASSRGKTIRKGIRRWPSQGEPARACRGRALGPLPGSLGKLASLSGEGPGVTKAATTQREHRAPLLCRWPNLGDWGV